MYNSTIAVMQRKFFVVSSYVMRQEAVKILFDSYTVTFFLADKVWF